MINNSAVAGTRGTINGIGQSLVALGRGAGPSIGALAFAWSERNGESELAAAAGGAWQQLVLIIT